MKITVLTLFPEMFENFLNTSIVGRSLQRGLAEVEFVQIRDFAPGNYKHVDDTPFGGGSGMVMKCQPVLDAIYSVKTENSYTLLTSPAGKPYTQQKARELCEKDHLIILCGHYEGMDARINDHVDELVSIGDYVLTGGELASMVIIDSVVRLLKGAIRDTSTDEESHENGLLEYPQYTHPADYNGEKVPEVLLSGNHAKIREWRVMQSLKLTKELRPDLYEKHEFTDEEKKILKKYDL
ncbi:MAG: tRNA (guanosine(37)-N1)-methyltransferase TrmD [Erysipelotrichaceae bacterium]|nr:tRNA (guanosine(37)-N1)-methyltransferase TrmD [Erysipelotrichaceae bacterium]